MPTYVKWPANDIFHNRFCLKTMQWKLQVYLQNWNKVHFYLNSAWSTILWYTQMRWQGDSPSAWLPSENLPINKASRKNGQFFKYHSFQIKWPKHSWWFEILWLHKIQVPVGGRLSAVEKRTKDGHSLWNTKGCFILLLAKAGRRSWRT